MATVPRQPDPRARTERPSSDFGCCYSHRPMVFRERMYPSDAVLARRPMDRDADCPGKPGTNTYLVNRRKPERLIFQSIPDHLSPASAISAPFTARAVAAAANATKAMAPHLFASLQTLLLKSSLVQHLLTDVQFARVFDVLKPRLARGRY